MSTAPSTPVPVHRNSFKVTVATTPAVIIGLEEFKVSFDTKKESWNALEDEGFGRDAITGRSINLSGSCKRIYSDATHTAIANMAFATGGECVKACEWTLPDGSKITFDGVFDVSGIAGGKVTDLDTLEFKIYVQGKPVITAPTA